MRRALILFTIFALFLAVVPATALAGGKSHAKATGEVWRTNAAGTFDVYTQFNAHDNAPGKHPDRGQAYLRLTRVSDGAVLERYVDVSCVYIAGNEAWFAGLITDGQHAGQGQRLRVQDKATPGRKGDKIGGDLVAPGTVCDPDFLGNPHASLGGTVYAGNLKVH